MVSPQSAGRDRFFDDLTGRLSGRLVKGGFEGLARLALLHPRSRPEKHGVTVRKNVPYAPGGADHHLLDVYVPRAAERPPPAMLYVHGGGFRILSKETHWAMALGFARKGVCVFNINYRLAPAHPFPAGLRDACVALAWVRENAARFGADPDRILLAGESAGANLVTSLAIAACDPRPEPWARALFELAPPLVGVLPACGLFQVNDMARFGYRGLIKARMEQIERDYLSRAAGPTELADPLLVCEGADAFARPLPPFFLAAGGRDVILADSQRLDAALRRRGVDVETVVYPGGVHAFHAFVWTEVARRAWRDQYRFLERVLS